MFQVRRVLSSGRAPVGLRRNRAPTNRWSRIPVRASLAARRSAFRAGQDLYLHDRKELLTRALNGVPLDEVPPVCSIPLADVVAHQTAAMQPNPTYRYGCLLAYGPYAPENYDLKSVTLISPERVLKARHTANARAAPGPDGVRLPAIKRVDPEGTLTSILFTLWFMTAKVPRLVKSARTVFLPKTHDGLDEMRNWRPITIGETLNRLYSRVLARLLEDALPLHPQQRGFLRGSAGCFENLWILQQVLHTYKVSGQVAGRRRVRLVCVFLDVSQAFPSVAHDHVLEALERLGVPFHFRQVICDLYTGVTMSIHLAKQVSTPIQVLRGVKQGDPLSSFLFNACMDPIICQIDAMGQGVQLATPASTSGQQVLATAAGHVGGLTFADDMAVLAETVEGMERVLEAVDVFYSTVGMTTNASKSKAFELESSTNGHTWLLNPTHFTLGGKPISSMAMEESTRYLGLQVGPDGVHFDPRRLLAANLACLAHAPLKGTQRVALLKVHLLPKYVFALTTTPQSKKTLRGLDVLVRAFVRNQLHLPSGAASSFIHMRSSAGGLGIVWFERFIPRLRLAISKKVRRGTLRLPLEVLGITKEIQRLRSFATSSLDDQVELLAQLGTKTWQGQGSKDFARSKASNLNLDPYHTWFTHDEFCNLVRMRTNTVPVRVAMANTRPGQSGRICCRNCKCPRETLGHVLGQCSSTKALRIARHDRIVTAVADLSGQEGWGVLREPTYTVPGASLTTAMARRLRPDLILTRTLSGSNKMRVVLVDVTIRFEGETHGVPHVLQAVKEKCDKYACLRPILATHFGTDLSLVTIEPFVLGSRGGIPRRTTRFLTNVLLLTRHSANDNLRVMSTMVVRDGVGILRAFMCREDYGGFGIPWGIDR